jgi:hypothetical protein
MVMPSSSIYASQLIEYTKRQFGDEAGIQINDSDIIRWANMAAIEICAKNSVIQAEATTNGVAGQLSYDLGFANDIIRIEDVFYGNIKLDPVDKSTFRESIQGDVGSAGQPVYWYAWANSIKLWPVPDKDDFLIVDYIKRPDIITSGVDKLPLPDLYYEQMCFFVMSKAFELDEDLEKSTSQRSLFENKLMEKNDLEKSMNGAFPIIQEDSGSAYYAWSGVGWS